MPVAEPLLCREAGDDGLIVLAGERTTAAQPTADHLAAARRACAALRGLGLYRPTIATAAAFLFGRDGGVRFADPTALRPARRRDPAPAPRFEVTQKLAPLPVRRAA